MATDKKKADTYSYKGWLNSDKFLKRAFAIYGYTMVAGLIIMVPFYALMFIIILIASLTM
ncbi:hypothetical protein J4209_03175 [Candidatus Woesearchaeota archaeon]|nr:hypothetical protein [Candidatus Woesearchaeota archaeon]